MLGFRRWSYLILVGLFLAAGCTRDEDETVVAPQATSFEVAARAGAAYLIDLNRCPGFVAAETVSENRDQFTIVDLRDREIYDAGHIPGAFHSTLGTLLTDLETTIPSGNPYVLASATGQSAGYAKFAMELLDYPDVMVLEYGMSAWHWTLDTWTGGCTDGLANPALDNRNAELTEHPFPDLGTHEPETVVRERVAAMLVAGYRSLRYTDVQDDLSRYFIVNYFPQRDYEATGVEGSPGHIPGAYQFTPYTSLGPDEQLRNVPPDELVLVYEWTGQHGAQITAYLNFLGYDAYNLHYGANALFHSRLINQAWDTTKAHSFRLETAAGATPVFDALARSAIVYVDDPALCPGTITAAELAERLDEFTVLDLRSEADYVAGHILDAVPATLAGLRTEMTNTIPVGKPYVLVSDRGHLASYAKFAMAMLGYEDTWILDFGISAWNPTVDSWTDAVGDGLPAPETENRNTELTAQAFPSLDDYIVATVLDERTDALLAGGYPSKAWSEVRDELDGYFVINAFDEADYEGRGDGGAPGHIPGAFQFSPYGSLGIEAMLRYVPTDRPILVYGWTGQHSAQMVAYLNLLGYEAYNLDLGANALFHSSLTARAWGPSHQNDFHLSLLLPPTATFRAVAVAVTGYLNDPTRCPGRIRAVDLEADLDSFTVVDLRPYVSYALAHIPGAHHANLNTLLWDLDEIPDDKPYVFVDYRGQRSGHAAAAVGMLGRDARALVFGMSAWTTQLDLWTREIADLLTDPETENQNHLLEEQQLPQLAEYALETVVVDRVTDTLARGFRDVYYEDVANLLDRYFIISYFEPEDYDGTGSVGAPGHLPGAFQFTPYASLGLDQMLEFLPSDRQILVYTWTGQHSSQVAFCLNALGYDAYTVRFGTNKLFHDSLTDHKWGPGEQNDFPLEAEPGAARR